MESTKGTAAQSCKLSFSSVLARVCSYKCARCKLLCASAFARMICASCFAQVAPCKSFSSCSVQVAGQVALRTLLCASCSARVVPASVCDCSTQVALYKLIALCYLKVALGMPVPLRECSVQVLYVPVALCKCSVQSLSATCSAQLTLCKLLCARDNSVSINLAQVLTVCTSNMLIPAQGVTSRTVGSVLRRLKRQLKPLMQVFT